VEAVAIERKWLDGPALVAWLEDERRCIFGEYALGFHARAIRHWRRGGKPSLYHADVVLTKLDVHLDELPDHLWIDTPKSNTFPVAVKREAVRRVLEHGETKKGVAQSIGCSPRALGKWIDEVTA
jgi:Transposase